uniref:Uncharacterized protein n=1 Tax=Mustela putorius furo TaxID=9669 RepID=M3Z7N9_MUSPF
MHVQGRASFSGLSQSLTTAPLTSHREGDFLRIALQIPLRGSDQSPGSSSGGLASTLSSNGGAFSRRAGPQGPWARGAHLDQQLGNQGLADDDNALVVAGHPRGRAVPIGQEDVLPVVFQKLEGHGHNDHLILALVQRRDGAARATHARPEPPHHRHLHRAGVYASAHQGGIREPQSTLVSPGSLRPAAVSHLQAVLLPVAVLLAFAASVRTGRRRLGALWLLQPRGAHDRHAPYRPVEIQHGPHVLGTRTRQGSQTPVGGLKPAPQNQETAQTDLSDASGRRPHVLSVHQDVHCVVGTPTDAHTAPHLGPRADEPRGSAPSPLRPPRPCPRREPAASPPASRGSGHSSSSGAARRASLHSWSPSRWSLTAAQAEREAALGRRLCQALSPPVLVWSAPGGGSPPTSRPAPPPSPDGQRARGCHRCSDRQQQQPGPAAASPPPTSKTSSVLSSLVLKTRP